MKSFTIPFIIAAMLILTVISIEMNRNTSNMDVRSRAADITPGPYASTTPGGTTTPTRGPTPSPSQLIVIAQNTNTSCANVCANISQVTAYKCIGVGVGNDATGGTFYNWTQGTKCYIPKQKIGCGDVLKTLTTTTVSCGGSRPQWTNCRCQRIY